ncbi:GNAT family N-acetyltransferase [Hyalangium rubrum]|uniref:GNAT family N-acetyltransferase n=1 Tax=Hyalangium rubrum TaxID=3103134 RepID=A0ABU5GVU6_9BACT|nr:GNAT family N-acetyltransferase [Hyalangium sp. s54d21]MDY7225166.1 GNAT family N-acetyltransferase [Hyalangium sp. s54d21]
MLELRTARLLLRPFHTSDEEALFHLWNEPQVRRYLWDDQPVAREVVREQVTVSEQDFRERGFGEFGLFLAERPGALMGFCGLRCIDGGEDVELLYGLLPAFWGRGLATEAAQAVLRFAFEQVGLRELWAGADFGNTASLRCLHRLGMTDAGVRRVGPEQLPAQYYRLRRLDFAASAGA